MAISTSAATGSVFRSAMQCGLALTDQPFFVSIRSDGLTDAQHYWDGLSVGATVIEPLAASAWSAGFGMLTDRFGVTWIVDVAPAGTYDAG